MSGEHMHVMPDLPAMMGHLPIPYGADPLWAARMQNITGLSPMLALQHNGFAHQYSGAKLPFGGLPSLHGYLHGIPTGLGAFLPAGVSSASFMPSSSSPLNLAPSRFQPDSQGFDVRKSSIEALRFKAKEHSASVEHRILSSVKSETSRS